jgi:cysteine synthase B
MSRSLAAPQTRASRTDDLLSSIGQTPLIRLRRVTRDLPAEVEVYAKAEHLNPGGSVKDRAARAMILDGERTGKLRPGQTILDATSGNTGIAYAMIGAARGYAVTLCVPKNASLERQRMLRMYGAELISTTTMPTGAHIMRAQRPKSWSRRMGASHIFWQVSELPARSSARRVV